ncbi:MAG: hypothetical protein JWN14_2860 [Chthonomonadales bacterium]|nr:hypothetical protein [Chthonomonadales bacterium]
MGILFGHLCNPIPTKNRCRIGTQFMADPEIEKVVDWLTGQPMLALRVGRLIGNAFDRVLDRAHTRRYDITQLDNVVKTHIGSWVETLFLQEFHLPNSEAPDTEINGVGIDIKWSINENWIIPQEVVGEPCLLLSAQDTSPVFSLGILSAGSAVLNTGSNQDKKRSISAAEKEHIVWLLRNEPLPENVLLHLSAADRDAILNGRSGQQRINELFRRAQRWPISTMVVDTVGRQRDNSKRVRDARLHLKWEGIEILHGKSIDQRQIAQEQGITLGLDEWASFTVVRSVR